MKSTLKKALSECTSLPIQGKKVDGSLTLTLNIDRSLISDQGVSSEHRKFVDLHLAAYNHARMFCDLEDYLVKVTHLWIDQFPLGLNAGNRVHATQVLLALEKVRTILI